jgi:hypothetical protein
MKFKMGLRQDLFNIGPHGKNVSKRFFSETTWTIQSKLPRNDHWKVLYKFSVFLCRSKIQDSMYCGGGHLGFPIGIKNMKFVEDLPMIIPGQFGFNCPSGFAATAGLNLTLDPMGKMFQNASSLKPLGQLKPNCPVMIIGRSSTHFMFFMPIENPRWPPHRIQC